MYKRKTAAFIPFILSLSLFLFLSLPHPLLFLLPGMIYWTSSTTSIIILSLWSVPSSSKEFSFLFLSPVSYFSLSSSDSLSHRVKIRWVKLFNGWNHGTNLSNPLFSKEASFRIHWHRKGVERIWLRFVWHRKGVGRNEYGYGLSDIGKE